MFHRTHKQQLFTGRISASFTFLHKNVENIILSQFVWFTIYHRLPQAASPNSTSDAAAAAAADVDPTFARRALFAVAPEDTMIATLTALDALNATFGAQHFLINVSLPEAAWQLDVLLEHPRVHGAGNAANAAASASASVGVSASGSSVTALNEDDFLGTCADAEDKSVAPTRLLQSSPNLSPQTRHIFGSRIRLYFLPRFQDRK
jgi:hypothetical protein